MVVDCKRETCESGACGQDARRTDTKAQSSLVHGVIEGVNHMTEFFFRIRVSVY